MYKKILISLVLAMFVLPASCVFAAVTIPDDYYPEGAPTIDRQIPKSTDEQKQIAMKVDYYRNSLTFRITNMVLYVAGLVAIFFIVYNGFRMVTAAGSDEVITQTKKGLTWAVVGLILIILSYSIMRFIISVPFNLADQSQVSAPASGKSSTKSETSVKSGQPVIEAPAENDTVKPDEESLTESQKKDQPEQIKDNGGIDTNELRPQPDQNIYGGDVQT